MVTAVKDALAKGGVAPGVCGPRVRTVTACQGSTVCPNGCIDAQDIAKGLHERYFGRELPHKFKFGVTGCVNNCLKADENDFTLRETVTSEIIDDVARRRSEVGVMYLSRRNSSALTRLIKKEGLAFEELFVSKPHVFVAKGHPLAGEASITPERLDDFPFVALERGEQNALYFAEEVMPSIDRKKNIRVRDRATMTNLILGLHGYTVASSAISRELNGPDIVAVPLVYDDEIRIGLLSRADMSLSRPGTAFADALRARVAQLV